MINFILSIDQGTTSSRAILFDSQGRSQFTAQREFRQIFPHDGWVEHDPEEIWSTTLEVCREAVAEADARGGRVIVIGITNQRETTIVWDRATGKPVYNAIVWQDRRTADICAGLRCPENEALAAEHAGLLLDPYFSATKVAWILDHVDGARARAECGELMFGTVDTFLLWRLTGGTSHVTDATNACRTLLYNIHHNRWDPDLLQLFRVPEVILPEVRDCATDFGTTLPELFGRAIAIGGVAGDQQSAAVGQACLRPGMIKSTYGTGCFALMNTGDQAVASSHRLLTTIAFRLDGQTSYAMEGSIFSAGSAVQWLRDGLKIIGTAAETESLAASLDDNHGVYLVPAFTGLGAPYWDSHARGALHGLTRDTGIAEIVRATLESVCYQTHDLLDAMRDDGNNPQILRVDGGMVRNDWLVQFLADILGIPIERPVETETTALGAAYLAGLQAGVYGALDDLTDRWQCAKRFEPRIDRERRDQLIAAWKKAVSRTLST